MGPGVSQESGETQDGLHVWEDHFLPEVIDPVTHEVLPDGEVGELVFTIDQAGDARGAVPHPRPDPSKQAGHGVPRLPADAEGHRLGPTT